MAFNCLTDNHPDIRRQTINFLLQSLYNCHLEERKPASTVCYRKMLPLMENTSNFAICSKPTEKRILSYRFIAAPLPPAKCLFDTSSGLNLTNPTVLPLQWTICIERGKRPYHCTGMEDPLNMEETIILQPRLGDLRVRVWFAVVHSLAGKLLLGTSFMDRFTRKFSPIECKAVPWRSHPQAIFSTTPCNLHFSLNRSNVDAP